MTRAQQLDSVVALREAAVFCVAGYQTLMLSLRGLGQPMTAEVFVACLEGLDERAKFLLARGRGLRRSLAESSCGPVLQ